METTNIKEFDFVELKNLYANGQRKDFLDAKEYIDKLFIPLTNGTHALLENEEIIILSKETLNEVYLSRFQKEIKNYYKTETIPKKLICDITKPQIGDKFINVAKQLKHEYKKFDTFSDEIKSRVQIMLLYIKTVWANENEKVYDYLLNWFSNMIKPNCRNKTCLFLKGDQGIGKSTFIEFLRDFVIGKPLTCKGKADHLKGSHNLQLLGRILVYFEELQIYSDKEWNAIDSEIKDMISDDWGSYTDKYEKRFEAENINNYIILCNKTVIKGINGRRYFVLDLSTIHRDDFEFYKNLRTACFNDEVGQAFYSFLVERDTESFLSSNMPETLNKKDCIVELLTQIEKFLKLFVLKQSGINMKVKDLHETFLRLMNSDMSIQKFCGYLRELGFNYKKIEGYHFYRISYEELKKLADQKNGSMNLTLKKI